MSSDKWRAPDQTEDPLPRRQLRLTGVFLAVVAAGLVGAWLFQGGTTASGPASASVGEPAPDFEIENIEGDDPIVLSELVAGHDGPLVLNLMASWCGPCREEIPELSAFSDANPDVLVLGVDVEDVYEDFRQFMSEVQPTYMVGFDDGDMRARYQTLGLPATFFLDSEGRIVDVFNGILNESILEEIVAGIR